MLIRRDRRVRVFALVVGLALGFGLGASRAQEAADGATADVVEAGDSGEAEARAAAHTYAHDYKEFIATAVTEVRFVEESIRAAERMGFREFTAEADLTAGAKLYRNNRDRALFLFVVGEQPFREGFRIAAAHIDAPHLDLKARPILPSGAFVQFQTMPHGGIKNYQWVSLPLALVGRVFKKTGEVVKIEVGLRPAEPVFVIPDLAPHVDTLQRTRRSRDVVQGEEMDPVVYSQRTKAAANVVNNAKAHLKAVYGIEEDDLVSAELNFVPALAPRDVGMDGELLGAYGQDDRSSAYAALRVLLETGTPRHTSMVFLANNEETGSNNNTGAQSGALNDLLAELIYRQEGDGYRDVMTRRALAETLVISCDANPGINPIWAASLERANAPELGKGVNFKVYGRGNSPNAETTARLRKIYDDEKIPWQVMTYKVGEGGGGTLGHFLSDDNMEVIDIGIPILSLHSPFEIAAKSDLHALYRALRAFFEKIDIVE
ncbi:MAG: aminopeptidase 1 [Acidobacteria bacterium]|nr:aminopeptidase 1 [Acidobacteriota bacterium]